VAQLELYNSLFGGIH